jgi:hypothetical protein
VNAQRSALGYKRLACNDTDYANPRRCARLLRLYTGSVLSTSNVLFFCVAHVGSTWWPHVQQSALQLSAATEALHPLNDLGILGEVLEFVGSGQFAFVAAVSKSFRAAMLKVALYWMDDYTEAGDNVEVEVLPTMTTHESIFETPSRLRWAIESGFILMTDSWRVQHRAGWYAAAETLLMLHESYGLQWTESISRGAAESGNVIKLRWLSDEQHCPQAEDIGDYAAASGVIETLAWLRKRGCKFTASTCARAVTGQDSEDGILFLQYLRKAGCEWDTRIVTNAAYHGDLELLQCLHKQGAPWDDKAIETAAMQDNLETLLWLKEHGHPCDLHETALDAASGDSISVLEWIRDSGEIAWDAPLLSSMLGTAAIDNAAEACKVSSHLPVLACMHDSAAENYALSRTHAAE